MRFRSTLKWLAFTCLCSYPAVALGQEGIRQVKVGPNGDQVRIVVAFIDPAEDGYRMQSLIIDVTPAKNRKETPLGIQVDLTSTLRSLKTGKKEQKILLLRWNGTSGLELKCDGQWAKQDAQSAAMILETVKAVIENVPLDKKTPTDVTLPTEIEQRVSAALESLSSKDLPCVKNAH